MKKINAGDLKGPDGSSRQDMVFYINHPAGRSFNEHHDTFFYHLSKKGKLVFIRYRLFYFLLNRFNDISIHAKNR